MHTAVDLSKAAAHLDLAHGRVSVQAPAEVPGRRLGPILQHSLRRCDCCPALCRRPGVPDLAGLAGSRLVPAGVVVGVAGEAAAESQVEDQLHVLEVRRGTVRLSWEGRVRGRPGPRVRRPGKEVRRLLSFRTAAGKEC